MVMKYHNFNVNEERVNIFRSPKKMHHIIFCFLNSFFSVSNFCSYSKNVDSVVLAHFKGFSQSQTYFSH